MKRKRYEVGCQKNLHVWIYDYKKDPCGRAHGMVARFNVVGDGYGSMNTYRQARRLAGRVCRFLNGETK